MKRGDILLCKFPHSSTVLAKNRPALVVQSDYYNHRIANLLVAGITGNLVNVGDSAHFLIDISTPEGQVSGLLGIYVNVPIWNKNQGNIHSANAGVRRAIATRQAVQQSLT